MARVIYFDAEPDRYGLLRFVKRHVPKRLFRKERFECQYEPCVAEGDTQEIYDRIGWFYPDTAQVWDCTPLALEEKLKTKRHWLIARHDGGKVSWFSHTLGERPQWTDDINDAEIQLDEDSAETFAGFLRRNGWKISVTEVFLNKTNRLLTPSFIIACTSRKGDYTKFFSRCEGGRLRLVKTSDAAKRFTLSEAQSTFEALRCSNKAFTYQVMLLPSECMNCKDLHNKSVPVAVEVTTKLRWLNREK